MASISRNVALYMQNMILNIYAEKPKPLPWHFPLHFPAGVCSLFGNSTLLYVSYKKKRHLKPAEYFIINLAVSDLGLTLSLYPMAISSSFYHRFTLIGWQYDYLSVMLTLLLSLFFSHSPSSASISLFLSFSLSLFLSFSPSFSHPHRWLYGKTVCSVYAFCGMLFGICSLTTLTLLSVVCFVKVCYPHYGKSSEKLFPTMWPSLPTVAACWFICGRKPKC